MTNASELVSRELKRLEKLSALALKLGYPEGQVGRLSVALTHRTFSNESSSLEPYNERLEFLGDAVLGMVIAELLMQLHPDEDEGSLSCRRASLVNARSLEALARELSLGTHMRLGKGEALTGGRQKSNLLADAFEAMLAAVYLDLGLDAVRELLRRLFGARLESPLPEPEPDYKSDFQAMTQGRYQLVPEYRLLAASGPDHDKTFVMSVWLGEHELASGQGHTKRVASGQAARVAMERLKAVMTVNELNELWLNEPALEQSEADESELNEPKLDKSALDESTIKEQRSDQTRP